MASLEALTIKETDGHMGGLDGSSPGIKAGRDGATRRRHPAPCSMMAYTKPPLVSTYYAVIAGLGPAIHHLETTLLFFQDGCAGTSALTRVHSPSKAGVNAL